VTWRLGIELRCSGESFLALLRSLDKYVQLLSEHFKCCDLGPTCFLLGVAVERDCSTHTLKLHQHQFILDLLEKYGISDCKPVQSPLPPKIVLSHSMSPSTQKEKDLMSEVPYLVGIQSGLKGVDHLDGRWRRLER